MELLDAFPGFKLEVKIPVGFEESYDPQESCPKWTDSARGLHLWIDYIDPTKREIEGEEQFALSYVDDYHTIIASNSYKEVLQAIEHPQYDYYKSKVVSARTSANLVELMSCFTRRVNSASILEQDWYDIANYLKDIAGIFKLADAQHTFLVSKELNDD